MATNPSTTELIQIQEFRDGVILLKDGSLRGVVKVSAINFELRSSDEQTGLLQQFAGFLNSLDFPFQIVIQSRRYDIAQYIALVEKAAGELTNELLKVQAGEYIRFVAELSELSNIMSKEFYVVLPMTVTASEEGKGVIASVKDMFKKSTAPQGIPPERLAAFKAQLQQRADLIIGGLSGMGLKGEMLGQDGLVKLFNLLYNPVVPLPPKPTA